MNKNEPLQDPVAEAWRREALKETGLTIRLAVKLEMAKDALRAIAAAEADCKVLAADTLRRLEEFGDRNPIPAT